MDGLVDQRLVSVFVDLQETATRINRHWAQYRLLESSTFEPLYGSILSRLLALNDCLEDTMSECLRLGLLAFLVITTFRVPDSRASRTSKAKSYPHLATAFRKKCRAIEASTPRLSALVFWLLIIGAMSVLDVEDEGWLVKKWNEVARSLGGERTWEGARVRLEGVLWMNRIHDDVGKETFLKLMAKDQQDK